MVSVSPDAALLAVVASSQLSLYSTAQLARGGSPKPLRTDNFPEAAVHVAWKPSVTAALSTTYAALLESGAVALVDVTAGAQSFLEQAPPNAASIAWNPDGSLLALGHGNEVSLCSPSAGGAPSCTMRVSSQDVQEDAGQALAVEGLTWLSASSLLVTARLMEDEEMSDLAPACVLSWHDCAYPQKPQQLRLSEFFALGVVPSPSTIAPHPCLLTATVTQWGAVVYAHSQAADDHIKVATAPSSGEGDVTAADITDDRLAIRIPNAPGDEDNHVVGLGMDLTATGVAVEHPTDTTAPNLPPQPLLWVATSDCVFRAYTFGSTKEKPAAVTDAQDLPLPPSVSATPGAATTQTKVDGTQDQAAATALPDEDSDFGEESEEEEQNQKPQAASKPAPAVSAPASTPSLSFGGGAFGFGVSGGAAASSPASSPSFGFGGVSASGPSVFAFSSTPLSTTPATFGVSAAKPSQLPSPPISFGAPSVELPLAPKPQDAKPSEPSVKPTTATSATPAAAPKPAKSKTEAPPPISRLAGASEEAAALERDFLKSLSDTRRLEAELHNALTDTFRGSADSASKDEVEALRHSLNTMRARAAAAGEALAAHRGEFEGLAAGVKAAYTKMEAMPAFSGDNTAVPNSDLIRQQPLDPALGALRDQIRDQLRTLALKVEEVRECLATLEERQRQGGPRGGAVSLAGDPRAQALALYEAVNAQTAVIQAQAARLNELAATTHAEGLVREASLDFDTMGKHERRHHGSLAKVTRTELVSFQETHWGADEAIFLFLCRPRL